MSQNCCECCGFPVPTRWLYAGCDLSRPNRANQCSNRSLIRSERPPKCLPRSPDLRHVQTSTWRRASVAPTIQVGA